MNNTSAPRRVSRRRHESVYTQVVCSCVVILAISVGVNFCVYYYESKDFKEVLGWLRSNELESYASILHDNGYTSLLKVSSLSKFTIASMFSPSKSPSDDLKKMFTQVANLKRRLQFKFWLYSNKLKMVEKKLSEENIDTLTGVLNKMDYLKTSEEYSQAWKALKFLENHSDQINQYPVSNSHNTLYAFMYNLWAWLVFAAKLVLALAVLVFFVTIIALASVFNKFFLLLSSLSSPIGGFLQMIGSLFTLHRRIQNRSWYAVPSNRNTAQNTSINASQFGFIKSLLGNYLDVKKAVAKFDSIDVVGSEVTITVMFYNHNGITFGTSGLDSLNCEVLIDASLVESNIVYSNEPDHTVTVHFTPIKSGLYTISMLANGKLVTGKTLKKLYKPAGIDALKSCVAVQSSLLVLQEGHQELLNFNERDKYGNPCISQVEELYKYQFEIYEIKCGGEKISPKISFFNDNGQNNKAWIIINKAGVYTADVYYGKEILSDNIIMLVLTAHEMHEVNKNLISASWNLWYECYLSDVDRRRSTAASEFDVPPHLSNNRRRRSLIAPAALEKRKKVYCYITSKFLIIKEYYLKIIPRKLYTFRIKPSVKIILFTDENENELGFRIENMRGHVDIYCQQRNVLVATFVKLLLKNIGGSESFADKKEYFYKELRKLHAGKIRSRTSIKVKRTQVIKDTWKTVKSFSQGDWWKKPEVTFQGELGLDYGGLTREWMELLIKELFHAEGALFRKFKKDDPQALIHPSHFRSEKYQKPKLFELAGLVVGKCLVECACGAERQLYVKARFTRSFLSQILGLGVSWKHFDTDDKEYFSGKIKYILENDPEYLDLTFTEDVYDHEDKLVKTIELKHNGSKIEVKESNKLDYIQRLAEYRLSDSVKDEIASFMKGLNAIVPEGLLSIFDENELELLICGMDSISVSDLKANCIVAGQSDAFKKVMRWFWTIVSGLNQEELSRLLQFTTGCSQLPPNGFVGLVPKFQITAACGIGTLPTAHTCFNNLCLPIYANMEEMQKKLLLAINEGNEGFGMI